MIFLMTAGLVITASISSIEELHGGEFSASVVDLDTGEVLASTGSGAYPLACPDVFVLAHAVSVAAEGDESMEDLMNADPSTLSEWLEDQGMNDTHLTEEHETPVSSAEDVAEALRIVYSGMGSPGVSLLMPEPDMGSGHASTVGLGWDLYGWSGSGEGFKTFVLMALSQQGRNLGLVLMSRGLCCQNKGDLAIMLLWKAVEEI